MKEKAIAMIKKQMQENNDNCLLQDIGQSLISLCNDEKAAEILAQDLEVKELNLKACYDKFYKYANDHKKNNCFAGGASIAERLIRDFYGIHEDNKNHDDNTKTNFSLADFMQ